MLLKALELKMFLRQPLLLLKNKYQNNPCGAMRMCRTGTLNVSKVTVN